MISRVDALIERLHLTCDSLAEACAELGFEEADLTQEEEQSLYSSIFQCNCCGYWNETSEQQINSLYEPVCRECYEN